ncbi:MAG: Fe(2+)-trafficking protein [Acidobacteriota bacterium]
MAEIRCSRCGKAVEPMASAPFPGDLGVRVRQQVCAACWKGWLGAQVNLINEHRFTMLNPDHRAALTAQMKVFLNLSDGG